jgi:hypothetical protein
LRWAITAVEPGEEQQLTGSVLLIEAVVLA